MSGFSVPFGEKSSSFVLAAWVKRKARQLLLPFGVWSFIMFQVSYDESPYGRLSALLTGYNHLWFIAVLLQLLAIAYFFRRVTGPCWAAWMLAIGSIISGALYIWLEWLLWTGADDGTYHSAAYKTFAPWLVFFALGAWLRQKPSALRWLLAHKGLLGVALALSFVAFVAEWYLQDPILGTHPHRDFLGAGIAYRALGPLFLLGVIVQVQKNGRVPRVIRILASGGRYTYGVYLSHYAIILVYLTAAVRWNPDIPEMPGSVPLLAVSAGLSALVLVRLVKGTALGLVLFGEPYRIAALWDRRATRRHRVTEEKMT